MSTHWHIPPRHSAFWVRQMSPKSHGKLSGILGTENDIHEYFNLFVILLDLVSLRMKHLILKMFMPITSGYLHWYLPQTPFLSKWVFLQRHLASLHSALLSRHSFSGLPTHWSYNGTLGSARTKFRELSNWLFYPFQRINVVKFWRLIMTPLGQW